jgi:hypothetical protein
LEPQDHHAVEGQPGRHCRLDRERRQRLSIVGAARAPVNGPVARLPLALLRHHPPAPLRDEPCATAVNRIVTEGISPEQAVNDAIARIKQILSE